MRRRRPMVSESVSVDYAGWSTVTLADLLSSLVYGVTQLPLPQRYVYSVTLQVEGTAKRGHGTVKGEGADGADRIILWRKPSGDPHNRVLRSARLMFTEGRLQGIEIE